MSRDKLILLIELHRRRARSGDISSLTRLCYGGLDLTPFHNAYYAILSAFARKQLRRLMISIPPQHGKSLGSTVMLPSHLVTIPNTTVAIGSYSQTSAERLMRGCRRTIQSEEFQGIYSLKVTDVNTQRLMAFDNGSELMAVGREGSLTGNKVDVMILDDLYKDALEANSPLIRENCWEWYTSVVRSREHNDSCEIIVFTRWHEEDLIGRIKEIEEVVEVTDLAQLDNWSPKVWAMINFEAIKTTLPTPLDPREEGQALWEDRHSVETLREKKKLDPTVFECLYQGNPQSKKGLLYTEFTTYDTLPNEHGTPSCCIDVADTGTDYLCAICYTPVTIDGKRKLYITDVEYTQEPMEVTEELVVDLLIRNRTQKCRVESNNGGRGFARTIRKMIVPLLPNCEVSSFHRAQNKESRIITNSSKVTTSIVMPSDWQMRFPLFYQAVTKFERVFAKNKNDDAPDTLTTIVEKEEISSLDFVMA